MTTTEQKRERILSRAYGAQFIASATWWHSGNETAAIEYLWALMSPSARGVALVPYRAPGDIREGDIVRITYCNVCGGVACDSTGWVGFFYPNADFQYERLA